MQILLQYFKHIHVGEKRQPPPLVSTQGNNTYLEFEPESEINLTSFFSS